MKIKKLLSAVSAFLMGMSILPAAVHAAEQYSVTDNGDGTVAVKWTDTSVVEAEIPAEVGGKTVTALDANCFDGCSSLELVTIPDTVKVIKNYAFQDCVLLDTVEIPASVEEIGEFCFEGCQSLEMIVVDEENEHYCDADGVLYTRNQTELVRYPAAKPDKEYTIGKECGMIAPWGFTECRYLESVKMEKVNSMGADCFMGCAELKKVNLSDGITELIGASFAKCSNLRTINMPKELKSIGDRCFFGDKNLSGIKLPETLESIGEMAFYGCTSLESVYIPGKVSTIGANGIGITVASDGSNVVQKDFKLEMPVGSYAMQYAKENDIPYQGKISQNVVLLVLVGLVLVILLVVGIVTTVRSNKAKQRAEEERIAQEQKEKMLAERRAERKRKKEQK